jgi:predicted MFS family arabinose efflux permease
LVGRFIDRGQGRIVMTSSAIFGALFLALLTIVTAPWQFIALWIAIGLCTAGCLYEACFALITRAMTTNARSAITRVTLVAGFAGTLCFPSAHVLIGAAGWRLTILIFAAVILAIAVPLMWYATGAVERQAVTANRRNSTAPRAAAMTILGRPIFWFLAIAFATIAVDHGMMVSHILPILNSRGLSADSAVFAASMMGPMQVLGRLAMAASERHLSTLGIAFGCFSALTLSALAILAAASDNILIAAFIVIQGAAMGVITIVRPVVTASLLGHEDFGMIAGMMASFYIAATAIAPALAALLWDYGGYDSVISVALVLAGLGLLLFAIAWFSGRRMQPSSKPS